jgi:pilus assembly protein CpaB
MADKPKFRVILIIILALATTGLVYSYLKGLQNTGLDESKVVVVSQKVAAGTLLTQDMVKETKMPLKYIQPGAVTASSNVVNHYTTVDLWPDEVVLKDQLTNAQTSNDMNYKIPKGKRAVTIAINPVSGVAGFIKPGNRIDMIICLKPETGGTTTQSLTLLQNIEVLAVGSQTSKEEAPTTDNITLAVTPQEAQWVTLAESTGKIKLTLRPTDDNKNDSIGVYGQPALLSQAH